jgi:hypothetical protein
MRYQNKTTGIVHECWQWKGGRIAQFDKTIPRFVFRAVSANKIGLTSNQSIRCNLASRMSTYEYIEGIAIDEMFIDYWITDKLEMFGPAQFESQFELFE